MLAAEELGQLGVEAVVSDDGVDLGWLADLVCADHAEFAGIGYCYDLSCVPGHLSKNEGLV